MDIGQIITELSASASGAIVAAMATDAWTKVRTTATKFFGRADPARQEEYVIELDRANRQLKLAAPETRVSLAKEKQEEIQEIIANLLTRRPELIDDIRSSFVDGSAEPLVKNNGNQDARASDDARQAVQYQGLQANNFEGGKGTRRTDGG